MKMLELKDKRVLVLGLGDTGLSALRWLARHGARLSAADTRAEPPGLRAILEEMPGLDVHLGPFQHPAFAGAELIVASPGVPLAEPEIQAALGRGIPVMGDVELFSRYRSGHAKVLAVTGTNGKSTVAELTGALCRAAGLETVVAGNIGLPVLDVLEGHAPEVFVLELSSFQLETTAYLSADVATVLNVTEDHMDRYADLPDYAAAKSRIFQGHGVQVLNRQDVWSRAMAQSARQVITFGTDEPPTHNDFGVLQRDGRLWLAQGGTELMAADAMPLAGMHNVANALAALALCRAIGLEYAPLLSALRAAQGLPHRVEWVAEHQDIAFYDDSKGTNVGATCAALSGLPRKAVLIAGGDGKGQDFAPLRDAVARNARAVVLMGRDAPRIAAALQGIEVPVLPASDMEDAVRQAHTAARAGDAVLLSPACASFDMFRNYVHRAEAFVDAVRRIGGRS